MILSSFFLTISLSIVLVGNKNDLNDDRVITSQEGKQAATEMHAEFVEITAKNHVAVTSLFHNLVLSTDKETNEKNSGCIIN